MKVFREPCYFAEAVYLLYSYVNHISYEEDYQRVAQSYGRQSGSRHDALLRRIGELNRIMGQTVKGLDPENPRLRHFFEKLPGTDRKSCCCLAQVMLLSVPLDCSSVDDFAGRLLESYCYMENVGMRINDLNTMGLVVEQWDDTQERISLAAQIETLPCAVEGKWEILRALTDFEGHLRELTELVRPVAKRLSGLMEPLLAMNDELLEQWQTYFEEHTVNDFQAEMFNASPLYTKEAPPQDIWLGIWNFNPLGFWSEWLEPAAPRTQTAYLGMGISFDFAAKHKVSPDEESLCTMLRALSGKDKLEILRRCALEPCSAAKLAASMHLNSGTVSRNLYGLYKLGYLDTKADGERVNYVTRLDNLERLFRWIMDYIAGGDD